MATELARTLTPEELIKRGICPVKQQYIRQAPEGKKLVQVVLGTAQAATATGHDVQKKSKRQQKKDWKEKKKASVCIGFIRDACKYGDACKFSHDLTDYVRERPPDLAGRCPFSHMPECPFGIACRWASKHTYPGSDKHRQLLESSTAAPQSAEGDAQLGVEMIELPLSTSFEKPINELSRDIQAALRKNAYDFSKASQALAALGIHSQLPKKFSHDKAGGGGGKNKKKAAPERDGSHGSAAGGGADSAAAKAATDAPGPTGCDEAGAARSDSAAACGDSSPRGQAAVAAELMPGSDATQGPIDGGANVVVSGAVQGDVVANAGCDDLPNEPAAKRARIGDDAPPEPAPAASRAQGGDGATVPIYDISAKSHHNGDHARLRPSEKRPLDFGGKLYLAPLTTAGNLPFRRVCKGLRCDITCGEMAMTVNLLQGQASEWALLKRHPCEDVFGVQICGSYPDTVARCCQLLDDTIDVDFVDINMGCPIDLVCNKGAGSSLLLKPKRMEQIVRAAASLLSCPLTFKTRTAYFDREPVAHEILPHAASWGAHAVTLHGRSRQQRYSRLADWDYINKVADLVPPGFPVIGNGDVFTWEDYEAHMATGKISTCMIGRGALIKPWIFTEIKEKRHWDISASERLDILKDFCRFGLEHWGSDSKGVENVRRFLLEWLSYLHRYVPLGLLEVVPQKVSLRPPSYFGRSDLETLLSSPSAADWVKISEMLLGPAPEGFQFAPKHKSNSYAATEGQMAQEADGDENG